MEKGCFSVMGAYRVSVLLLSLLEICTTYQLDSIKHQVISEHPSSIYYWKRFKRQAYASDIGISVDTSLTQPESGPWGPWVQQGTCSRTCGGGVVIQERTCRGACVGHKKRYVSCNLQPCEDGKDFRAEQCEEYNDKPLEGIYYKWKPITGGKNKCELNCQPVGQNFFYKFKDRVTDGTKCDDESDDICVEGLCLPVGCDGRLGSTSKTDKCLVCNGKGDTCKTVSGFFDERDLEAKAYHDIVSIPEGSTMIKVLEKRATNNYLAIRNDSDHWYLNGNFKIDMAQTLDIAGTKFVYERRKENGLSFEKLRAKGPLTEEITIALLYQSDSSTGVQYEFSVPLDPDVQYIYEAPAWSACSVTCGKGVKTREPYCTDTKTEARVNNDLCDNENASKPETEMDCETVDCDASWFTGDWEDCSETCGDSGEQYRVVYCHQVYSDGRKITVDDEKCSETKPEYKQTCNRFACPEWNAGPWSACSKPCGEADQYRSVTCRSEKEGEEGKLLASSACNGDGQPGSQRSCNLGPCEGLTFVTTEWELCEKCNDTTETREVSCEDPTGRKYPDDKCEEERPSDSRDCATPVPCVYKWHTSQWSDCSTKCGHGHQTRTAVCAIEEEGALKVMDDSHCDPGLKPTLRQNCTREETCTGTWMTAVWSECTASCAGGTQTRKVVCFNYDYQLDMELCDEAIKPSEEQQCNTHDCPTCDNSTFGCCPDNTTFASGLYLEGCSNCSSSEFGCCSDNYTDAQGADFEGCPDVVEGSGEGEEESKNGEGGESPKSDCENTEFGCCDDGVTNATGTDKQGCECEYTNEKTGETLTTGCVTLNETDGVNKTENLLMNTTAQDNATEANVTIHCSKTEFGCCPDWYTDAEGPDNQGCPEIILGECNGTKFGCCVDEVALARGENYEGCGDVSCVGSLYGCCKDRRTIAFGPHYKGCERSSFPCETSSYGCCPDGETAALGDKGEGCESSCLLTKYGCCPDGVTAAEGAKNEGCGCRYSRFGCCADGKTAAKGPGYAGCPQSCAQSTHGCCPDGTTAAQGPNLEGCPCEFSPYGCCADGVTAARGPNRKGCDDCRYAKYGCCADGETIALGPNYKGCPVVTTTQSSVAVDGTVSPTKIAACSLPQLSGTPCAQWSLKYYYDTEQGECRQFWYGGCRGNDNRFDTKEYCDTVCINPPGVGVCYLPNMNGQKCKDWALKYYYDLSSGSCRPFYYGGCKGNKNNFDTEAACMAQCGGVPVPGQTPRPEVTTRPTAPQPSYRYLTEEECRAPFDAGSCTNYVTQYYFESYSGRCKVFHYGGCAGNSNRFTTEYECRRQCEKYGAERQEPVAPLEPPGPGPQSRPGPRPQPAPRPIDIDPCSQRMDSGDPACSGRFSHWYYDVALGSCLEFQYTGCGGNYNKFKTLDNCRERCVPQTRRRPAPFPALRRSTNGRSENVEVAPTVDPCANVLCDILPVEQDCIQTVEEPYYITYTVGDLVCPCTRIRCVKRKDPCENVKCDESEPVGDDCLVMVDSVSRVEIELGRYCDCTVKKCALKNIDDSVCELPKDQGDMCQTEFTRMWFYNKADGTCKGFYYGGCEGNGNRFISEEECRAVCGQKADPCTLPKVLGPCRTIKKRYFYNADSGACESFNYGGCLGNSNNFGTLAECQERCNVIPEDSVSVDAEGSVAVVSVSLTDNVETLAGDPCTQEKAVGRCKGHIESWYYDQNEKQCRSFVYGGCGGTKNRFDTKIQCEETCRVAQEAIRENQEHPVVTPEQLSNDVPTDTQRPLSSYDICTLPQDPGSCEQNVVAWSYDILDGVCVRFWYRGCDGNQNRFDSKEACLSVCGGHKIQGGFERPTGVESTVKPTEFDRPYPQVITYAPPTSILPELCKLPGEAGDSYGQVLSWFYNLDSGKCESLLYTGTKGNANRFSSREACQRACGQYRDQDVCSMAFDQGSCDRTVNRWYFDSKRGTCELFHYGGCGGNGNRFSSKEECLQLCTAEVKATTDVCKMEMDTGPCRAAQERFAFDSEIQECVPFIYGGCQGNQNNFLTLQHCQERCERDPQLQAEDICLLKRDSGPCSDAVSQWYFDKQYGECRRFTYGGCRGNDNRFNTRHECQVRCKGKKVASLAENPEKVCFLKFDVGSCRAQFSKWYFNADTGYCEQFIYGGCLGNANNFDTKKECEATCGKFVPKKPQGRFRVMLVASQRSYKQGDTIELICRAVQREAPEKGFIWYKDTSRVYPTDEKRIQIYLNGTLIIEDASPSDSGKYTCAPDVQEDAVFSSAVRITVRGGAEKLIQRGRVDCVDMEDMANCKLVVRAGLCGNQYYGVYCCRSCQRAGVRIRRRRLR